MDQFLSGPQRRDDLAETHLTHHHQIHITGIFLLQSGHRAIDEGHLDPAAQRSQRLAQDIRSPRGFDHQAFQLGKNRTLRIRLVINLVPATGAPENPHLGEPLDLPLDCSQAEPARANQLTKIIGLVGMPIKQSQKGSPRLAEERRRQVRRNRRCTHIGYNCTQLGYSRQAETSRR